MKKILGLAFGLMIGSFVFGQSTISFSEDLNTYNKANVSEYHFLFDSSISDQAITDNAQYYTDYFTVTQTGTQSGTNVTITLLQDDEISRKVIQRYFTQFQVPTINVGSNEVDLVDFMSQYIYQ